MTNAISDISIKLNYYIKNFNVTTGRKNYLLRWNEFTDHIIKKNNKLQVIKGEKVRLEPHVKRYVAPQSLSDIYKRCDYNIFRQNKLILIIFNNEPI